MNFLEPSHHGNDRTSEQRSHNQRTSNKNANPLKFSVEHKIADINKLNGHKPTYWAQIPSCTIYWQELCGKRISRLQNILVRKLPEAHTRAQFRSILNLPHLNLKLVQIWPAAAHVINRHTINLLLSISFFANSTSRDSHKFAPRTSSHHTIAGWGFGSAAKLEKLTPIAEQVANLYRKMFNLVKLQPIGARKYSSGVNSDVKRNRGINKKEKGRVSGFWFCRVQLRGCLEREPHQFMFTNFIPTRSTSGEVHKCAPKKKIPIQNQALDLHQWFPKKFVEMHRFTVECN